MSRLSTSGPHRSSLRRRSRGGAPGGALALLLALAVLALAVPSKAQAEVLVSNLNQVATDFKLDFSSGATRYLLAQGFTTGANSGGYTLTSIEVAFVGGVTATQIGDLTVSVWSDDGSGNPNAELFTLTKPASIDGATYTQSGGETTLSGNYAVFTAPANTALNASAQYHMVVGGGPSYLWSVLTDADTGAPGWSIADAARWKETTPNPGSWAAETDGESMSIRVNGEVGPAVDTMAPTVTSIVRQTPTSSPTNADSLTWQVTFSENVKNVTAADFAIAGTNATLTVAEETASTVYDVTVSGGNLASLDATVTLSFESGQDIADTSPAANALSNTTPTVTNDNTYVVDNTAPTVTITDVPGTSLAAFTATFTFSEDVTGFEAGDITVGNGTASAFAETTAGSVYTALITPATNGEVTVDVAADVATDEAGNDNTAATQATSNYTVDTTAPTVTSIERQDPTSSPTNADSLIWRVTFNENVQNVDAADFALADTTTATVTAVDEVTASMYDVTASGGNLAGLNATVTLSIVSSQNIADTSPAANALSNTTPTVTNDNTYVVDNTAPTVTITGVPGTSTEAFTATFTFSEAVTGFVVADITLVNATASTFSATSTTVYTALITSTASGTVTETVTVDVAAGAALDAAGNGNTAATQKSSTYTSTNNLAVGGPTITGTAQVSQTLTADTTGITDADGLPSPTTYTYQWIRANGTEADITGANSSTYILVDADEGKTIKVRVTFNDNDGNAETLTSVATATVQAVTLRLMNGSGDHEGRLEMRYSGEWRPICDDYWTDVEAGVACRILGFTRGAVDNMGRTRDLPLHFGTAGDDFWLDNVNCVGDETNLIDCPRRGNLAVGVHNCRAREAVGVRCLTGTEPQVKAVVVSPASGTDAYAPGGTLQVTVQWTEAVVVPAGVAPKLWVRDDDSRKDRTWDGRVEYESGSGTDTLVFEGTLGGESFNKMKVRRNTLGEPGTIVSAEDPTIAANLAHDDSHLALMTATQIEAPVVVAVPVVEGTPVVGEPVDGAWTAGETVEVQLTFSAPVAVGITGGTPSIDLRLGTQTQTHHAQYTSGSGTNELVFGYTLAEDEGPHNTVLVPGDSLALNGGTIVSAADGTVDADLAHEGAAKMALPPLPVSERAVRDVADRPTARFSDVPATHDGATAFEVTLRFSEAPGLDEGTVRGAVEVSCASESCATVSGASRVTDREWTVTVEPSQAYAVTLTLPVRACGETGAVCIGGRALAGPASATIPGRALTATLTHRPGEDDVRGEHKGSGSGTFEVRLAFNTEPELSYKTVRDTMFDVTGGTITGARRVTRRNDQHFDIVVKPSGNDAMTFSLHSPLPACGETGSVCTEAGRMVEGPVSATVLGPVAISVADATVREEEGATLAFAVTLDREREADVTVDYATSNGTATAGEDYVAQSGDLTFAAGETAKTVEVEVLDDLHDEGTETMTLTLSNPSGARIADATATGSIENIDPMPQAWMVRFGRTVGSQVVDALGQRLGGGQASHVTVAGVPLTGGAAPVPEDKADDAFGLPEWAKDARREQEARTITADDLLLRSAFHLSSGSGEAQGPAFTTWGRVSTGGFSAQVDDVTTGGDVTMDGDVTTGLLGFDAEWDNLLAGVMLSQSTGEGAYRPDPGKGTDGGTLESDLTGVYPYARINLDARVSAWALAGAGSGSITLTQGDDAMKTDLSMRMGALGVRGQVLDGTGPSGMRLDLKSDAMWVGTKSARSAGNMEGSEGDVTRLRLVAQGERDFVLAEQGRLTPSAELGLRHDGGDAETGVGVELGAGLRYMVGSFTIEARARTLIAHEASGYEDWGASAAVGLTPGASGRGLSLSIAPTWGRTGSASERLWSARDAGELEGGGGFEADGRIEAQLGYGAALPHNRGLLTPYGALTLGSEGGRTMRGGARWLLDSDLAVTLEATRNESAGVEADNEVRVQAALRF